MAGKWMRLKEQLKIKRMFMRGDHINEIAEKCGRAVGTLERLITREGWVAEREEIRAAVLAESRTDIEQRIAKDLQQIDKSEEAVLDALSSADLSKMEAKDMLDELRKLRKERRALLGWGQDQSQAVIYAPGAQVAILSPVELARLAEAREHGLLQPPKEEE